MDKTFEQAIDDIINPWNDATNQIDILEIDKKIYDDVDLKKSWAWYDQPDIFKDKYRLKHQFPLPINGNFRKAKYLLLYSNPASETCEISKNTRDKLLKCFKLKEDAEFVIANSDWSKFYTKELNRFFRFQEIDNTQNVRDFLNEFCFVNYCAYSTGINSFNFSDRQIIDKISKLPSTEFVKKLVNTWIKYKGKDNIHIVRAREYVWRNHTFAKLDLSSLEEEKCK